MPLLTYPLPFDEKGRLAALGQYGFLHTKPERAYDEIARFAADLFATPIALISFVEEYRQFFKARVGLDVCETSRDVSFCAHALLQDEVLVVPDASKDQRFCKNPLVTGPPFIRFYAGAPLIARGGHRLGSVCVIDSKPREILTAKERGFLQHLAKLVMNQLNQQLLLEVRKAALKLAAATPDGIVCLDEQGRITFWNRAASRIFGRMQRQAMGVSLNRLIASARQAEFENWLTDGIADSGVPSSHRLETVGLGADGSEIPVELTLASWGNADARQLGILIRDISERHRAREWASYLSDFDGLTKLPNRARFTAAISESLVSKTPFCALKIALDKFKQVNATLGMSTGDALLKSAAQRIVGVAEKGAVVGRLGGDEFGILVKGCGDPLHATKVANLVLEVLRRPFDIEGSRSHLTASVGIAVMPAFCEAADADDVLKCALLALQSAKSDGGNQYRLFLPEMARAATDRRRLEEELRLAFEREEFELHYQPQYRLSDWQIVGAEALLRWRHPTRGLLLPGDFLAVLETSPYAARTGKWIIDSAVKFAAEIDQRGNPIRIGVNLFAAQLIDDHLADSVTEALHRHALPASLLELELTETTVLQLDERVLAPLRKLRDLGVGIAFDDYGTGFASLSLLKRYPLTRLKIDREFVRNLETDADDVAIVNAVLAMARHLGLHVIAEGIETRAQADLLLTLGCEEAQGFFFSRPIPGADLGMIVRRMRVAA